MNDIWRPIVAVLVVIVATSGAVLLLWHSTPPYAAAAALLIGASLVAFVLRGAPLIPGVSSHLPSCDNYKGCVAWIISIGGGAVVAFALVWILIKVTGYSLVDATGQTTSLNDTISLNHTISLPLIVIVGVTLLLIVIALVAFSFSVLGLSSARDALGLPDGSVRAIIALMLLVLFSIMSIFLYNSIASRAPQTLTHVTQRGIDDLRSHALLIRQEPEKNIGAQAAASETTYTATFRELNGPADDIAKQLIVMLGTLVTAVASFYFGSASVASASAAVLGQKPSEPLAVSVSPNPIAANG